MWRIRSIIDDIANVKLTRNMVFEFNFTHYQVFVLNNFIPLHFLKIILYI